MQAAYDFSVLDDPKDPYTGIADHRKLVFEKNGDKVDMKLYTGMSDLKPAYGITDDGDVVSSHQLTVDGTNAKIPMAPHSEDGIEQAKTGLATLRTMLADPDRYSCVVPIEHRDQEGGVSQYWIDRRRELDEMEKLIPETVTSVPDDCEPSVDLIPLALRPQSSTILADAVPAPNQIVQTALPVDPPHYGKAKVRRKTHFDDSELPIAAIVIERGATDEDEDQVWWAMIYDTGWEVDEDHGNMLYKFRFYNRPSEGSNKAMAYGPCEDGFSGEPEYTIAAVSKVTTPAFIDP